MDAGWYDGIARFLGCLALAVGAAGLALGLLARWLVWG